MTSDNYLAIAILLVVAVLVTVIVTHRLARRAPGKLETKVETDTVAVFTAALKAMVDTTPEDEGIVALLQRKQQKQLLGQHAMEVIQTQIAKTAPPTAS